MSLRHDLQGAIHQRDASLRNGRCWRSDPEQIRNSINKTQAFLNSYPVATDERVCSFIEANTTDIGRILLGNAKGPLAKVYYEILKKKSNLQLKVA